MKKKGKPKTNYLMHWQKDQQATFNYFILTVDLDYLREKENLRRFMELGEHLLVLFEPVQANIWNKMLPE